jgi:hypothetical protein
MAFLRFKAGQEETSVEEQIEQSVLGDVRAEMEGFSGEELIRFLNVGRIFYEILGDEDYKPKEKTN